MSTRLAPAAAMHVGHQLGRDRHARLVLAVLPGVAVVRNHRRDARRRRAPERVDHDEQLHQMLIDRRAGRLDDEDVGAADVLVDLERDLGVGEAAQPGLPERHAEELGDLPGQARVRAAGEHLQIPEARLWHRLWHRLSLGSAPPGGPASKNWLGRKDSNLRIRAPKARALPLGHAPAPVAAAATPRRPEPALRSPRAPTGRTRSRRAAETPSVYDRFSRRQAPAGVPGPPPRATTSGSPRRASPAGQRRVGRHGPLPAASNRPKTADPLPDMAA